MNKILLFILGVPLLTEAMHFSAVEGKFSCPSISNSMTCARVIEKKVVSVDRRVIRMSEAELKIKLNNGGAKLYKDRSDNEPYAENAAYSAIEVLPTNRHVLIHRQFYEGGAYTILNLETGSEMDVDGYPLVSPSLSYVVVANKDLDAGYTPNILQLYKFEEGEMTLIFDASPKNWGPDDVRWVNPLMLVYTKVEINEHYNPPNISNLYIKTPMTLIVGADGKVKSLNKSTQPTIKTPVD